MYYVVFQNGKNRPSIVEVTTIEEALKIAEFNAVNSSGVFTIAIFDIQGRIVEIR